MTVSDLEKDTKTTDNNKYSKSYQTISPNKLIKHLSYRTKKNEMCGHTCLILSRVSFFKLKLYSLKNNFLLLIAYKLLFLQTASSWFSKRSRHKSWGTDKQRTLS